MKSLLKKIAFLVYLLIACLLVGEITIRLAYDYLDNYNMEMWRYASELKQPLPYAKMPFHHYPDQEGHYYGVDVKINSLGLRDREYSPQKPSNVKRILFLGDSFTFGWGVPFEKLYAKQLEGLLNTGTQQFEVINMGIGNYNSIMEVELFKRKGLTLDPDMVVLMYFVNDAEPTPRVKSKREYFLLSQSYAGAFLFDQYVKFKAALDQDFKWSRYYQSLYGPENRPHLEANKEAIQELIDICNTRAIKLLIVSIPELRMLEDYPFPQATMFIENLAAQGNIPFLDLRPSLAGHPPQSLWVSREDPHANAFANGIIAEQIFKKISATSNYRSILHQL